MPVKEINMMVEGGKATVTPTMGQLLGPLGINTGKIIATINDKTMKLGGMQVPVKVIVNTATKDFKIEIGTPPVSALIKKEIKTEKGSGEAGKLRVGDLSEEQIAKIAKAKFGSADPSLISQVKGTCRSMGVSIGQGPVSKEEIAKATEKKEAKPVEAAAAPVPVVAPAKKEGKKRRIFKGKS